MSTQVYLAPGAFGAGYQGFTTAGLPLNAGLIYTYIAGGTTPQATYTDSLGNTPNANPIVLDADGRTPSEVWLLAGQAYRFDLKDSLANLIKTNDNLSGINDPAIAFLTGLLITVTGTNTVTATTNVPIPTAYAAGQKYTLTPANTNTGATTLNIAGLGAKNVFAGGAALVGGELVSGVPVFIEYDGTQLNIVNGAPFVDTRPLVIGSSDATKKVRLEVDGLTTATTRVLTMRDANFDIGAATQAEANAMTSNSVSLTPNTNKVILGTPTASTSGTSIDFTFPSGVRSITFNMVGVSTNNTSSIIFQLGDSGGIENSGYLGAGGNIANGGSLAATNYTAGFGTSSTGGEAAASINHGTLTLTLVDSAAFTWAAVFIGGRSNEAAFLIGAGTKSLSAELTTVRMTTAAGAATFDAGVVNVTAQR